MTQAGFCRTFGFNLDTIKHWEGGRRTPGAAARAFLTVIAHNPVVVMQALSGPSQSDEHKPSIKKASRAKAS